MNVPELNTRLRAVDAAGRFTGILVVVGYSFGGYLVRWAESQRTWLASERDLERLTVPARVRA
jgi:hypothetical protein